MFRQHAVHPAEGEALRAPRDLVIRSRRAGDVHLVALIGELDRESAPTFEAELKRVEATDAGQIIVDLSGLAFIGSDGLKVFIHATARSRRTGNRLTLVRASDVVQGTFEVAGLRSRLPFEDDRGAKRSTRDAPATAQIVVSRPVHTWACGGR
jgi:anti-sigma B factor antagonist